jgi:hypothetical protein
VLPIGAGAEVGVEPIVASDVGVDVAVSGDVGRWSCGATSSGTSEEHYRAELPQSSSSLFPCAHGLPHPR